MERWRARLKVLRLRQGYSSRHESYVSVAASVQDGDRTGNTATEMAYLEEMLAVADACYVALTWEETLYVDLRYKDGLTMADTARGLGISESGAYRLRREVLDKCHDILGQRERTRSD